LVLIVVADRARDAEMFPMSQKGPLALVFHTIFVIVMVAPIFMPDS
jgi:hypothetical protein